MGLFDKFFKKNVPVKEKIFEDYFTEIQTDMVSICLEYVEMGLYITSSIIKQHKGQILLKNSDITKGAEVIIKMPYCSIFFVGDTSGLSLLILFICRRCSTMIQLQNKKVK
ncbi:MAG: hypothetical protein ACLTKE_00095 [Coprococcus sp.]